MFRPPIASKTVGSNTASNTTNNGKQSTMANNENSPSSNTTIREIRSRTIGTTSTNNARHLLANRRQAMSMERLNSSASSLHTVNGNEKSSPSSGSSNSVNSSTTSSPQRATGLNRTASRVSRFRSAKAVFERLSSTNQTNNTRPEKPAAPEKPRGTVASRYAAAAAARATTHSSNALSSPKTRIASNSLARSQDSGKSASNIEIHRLNSSSTQSSTMQPKPQPRVITNRTISSKVQASSSDVKSKISLPTTQKPQPAPQKPPPPDLIDKIVLEIASDAVKQKPDPDCTIQDLSNCDISGIPETLDFDQCFQDVEMMTEEEAKKLLSRKPESTSEPLQQITTTSNKARLSEDNDTILTNNNTQEAETSTTTTIKEVDGLVSILPSSSKHDSSKQFSDIKEVSSHYSNSVLSTPSVTRCKVRFSEEPVEIYVTHAAEDYDRRNKDIDPVAASAEYELEKSKEREGIRDGDDSEVDESPQKAVQDSAGHFNSKTQSNNLDHSDNPQTDSCDDVDNHALHINQKAKDEAEEEKANNKKYIETLERELSIKHILEQNLRDLQSQYYEAVRELDDYKSSSESKLTELEKNINELNGKLEKTHNELTDSTEKSNDFEKQLNDIKESSQILEKKYHRAKRIIKDMQSREQSFSRREQLYQQKLDEIEYELGVLIESIYKTIYEDGIKFHTIVDTTACSRQHQVKLDPFGLIRQILNNFDINQSTQNPQIKQRVVSILEQQLANLLVITNDTSATLSTGNVPLGAKSDNYNQAQIDSNKHSQNSYNLASHRLSQPNLPHPIGVSGQPTKLFHGLTPMPITVSTNEASPPQSVNSYPSTNSLNSLNNNNNNNGSNNNNNNIVYPAKQQMSDIQHGGSKPSPIVQSIAKTVTEDRFQPVPDIQVPYQTNEWHDKPVCEWTTTQVSTWLLALGLDQYISKFEDRNVNGQSLINLDSTVLKGLGVLNSNDRNLLKKKIRELRLEMEKERKLIEKKLKENLKDKSKIKPNGSNKTDNRNDVQQNKPSWKRGLLS